MFEIKHVLAELKKGAVFIFRANRGILAMKGADAKDFLQRCGTNDLSALSKNFPLETSFTNNKGRLIDHCLIFEKSQNDFVLVSSHQSPEILYNWLETFHFVEDFSLVKAPIPFHFRIQQDSRHNHGFKASLSDGSTFYIIGSLDDINTHHDQEITEELFETLRILALMPKSPDEINDRWMPQNINLGSFISHNKGCYIGQEVIAKAYTYQKHVKTLGGAVLARFDWEGLTKGSTIISPDGQLGEVTSVAPLHVEGEINALVISEKEQSSLSKNPEKVIKSLKSFKFC